MWRFDRRIHGYMKFYFKNGPLKMVGSVTLFFFVGELGLLKFPNLPVFFFADREDPRRHGSLLTSMTSAALKRSCMWVWHSFPTAFSMWTSGIVIFVYVCLLVELARMENQRGTICMITSTHFYHILYTHCTSILRLGGGFKQFLFSPLFGEDSHFD